MHLCAQSADNAALHSGGRHGLLAAVEAQHRVHALLADTHPMHRIPHAPPLNGRLCGLLLGHKMAAMDISVCYVSAHLDSPWVHNLCTGGDEQRVACDARWCRCSREWRRWRRRQRQQQCRGYSRVSAELLLGLVDTASGERGELGKDQELPGRRGRLCLFS
ncbi:hypothetical protein L7F22_056486 [Adiantum nelumboides]|nr:hypothetical protein [Adiantum nelumboides]